MRNRIISIWILGLLVLGGFLGLFIVTDQVKAPGPTYVSGLITSDTTWYFIDSPYIVTDDVTVQPGFKLTIEPGVEVKFDGTHSLIVDGTLVADGTSIDTIKFTSNSSSPAKGDWYTIRLRTDYNLINYAEVEYASYGVFMTLFGTHNTISNSTFQYCKFDGIYITNSDNNMISNCTCSHNDRFGITIYESYGTLVDNCTIQDNNYFGINLNASTFTRIFDTNISYNNGKGILLYSNSHNTTISGCEVGWNNNIGIDLWGALDNNIFNTTVIGNNGIGIDFHEKTRNQLIENCTVMYNNNTGIDLRGSSFVDIVGCNVSKNIGKGGIYSAEPVTGINIEASEVWNNLAGNGIDLYETKDVQITYSKISKNVGNGVYFRASLSHSDNLIKNCTITENGQNGVILIAVNYGDNSIIKNNNICYNIINSNKLKGIYFNTVYIYDPSFRNTYVSSNHIHSNSIYSNGQDGICFFSEYYRQAYIQYNNIHSNKIYSNSRNGIYFSADHHDEYYIQNNDIHNNLIYLNEYNGLYFDCYRKDSIYYYFIQNNNIFSNSFTSNAQNGISFYVTVRQESHIDNNRIYSNEISQNNMYNTTLHDALDNYNMHFAIGGASNWEVNTSNYQNDGDSISLAPYTYIEAVVFGPGRLTFHWMMLPMGDERFGFYIDSQQSAQLWTPSAWWDLVTFDIPAGMHYLKWQYFKISGDPTQYGSGFLDNVQFTGLTVNSGISFHAQNPAGVWQESHIYNNSIVSNNYGIVLSNVKSQVIYANNITNNNEGVMLYQSSINTLRYNNITYNNGTGIYLYSSSNNIIENNNITSNNKTGILITEDSNNNLIWRNNITYNLELGLNITDSSGNQIHHNNFINNIQNAYDSTIALNDWDDGAEGNFWSDYLGIDDDGDGFGEDPYVIPGGGSRDWHPFIEYVNVTPPYIIYTIPADGDINVPVDTTISIFFSKEMDTASVESAISISGGLTPTGFVWDVGNKNVTFTPSSILEMATKYTVTINTDAMDTQGFRIRITYLFTFRTLDIDPPVIILTSPIDGDTFVDRNAPVIVTFNESMNISSVTFSCFPDPGGWTVSWNENNTVATYSHYKFGNEATYTFNITSGKDLADLDLVAGPVPNPWWFSTPDTVGPEITSTSPMHNEKNVSITADIVVDFNEEIEKISITYTCKPDPLGWSIVWTNNNKTATFSHNDFTERTWYSFHVTGAKDLLGNNLNPGPVPNPWYFTTTGDYTPPQITLTSPANNTFDVELDADIVVTFNEAMDNSSLNFICIPDPGGWSESWSAGNTIVIFKHNPFENATTYRFHINTARDIAGNNLVQGVVPNPWSFTTVGDLVPPEIISTSPAHNEDNVLQDADVVVTFNEAMDPAFLDFTCTPDPGGWTETWSTQDMIVTFSHDPFEIKTPYIFQITGARDRSGNDLIPGAVPNPWLFTTVWDIVGPQIILTIPADNEIDVESSYDIIVTFNEAMDNSSLSYICIPDPGGWSESWNNGDTVVTFTHNPLAYGTIINFYVIAAKDISGNDLVAGPVPNPWSFTTSDFVAPKITSTLPADNEIDVNPNKNIEVTFSEPMDKASITFICTPDPGGWSESWSDGDTVVTFSHDPFVIGTIYNFYIIAGKDISGNDLTSGPVPNPWSFSTLGDLIAPEIITTSPADNEVNVDIDAGITVTLSEKMDIASINYICVPDPGGWSESWSNGDTIVTFSHNSFAINTIYNFYIITGNDVSGNDLTSGPVPNPWSFTTIGDLVAPQISSTSPADNEINVDLNTLVTITFNEAMDTLTIEYTCSPDPGGWFESWGNGNTVFTLLHNPFEIGTTYIFQVTAGKDMAGNNLTLGVVPHSWDFTTISVESLMVTPSEVTIPLNGTIVFMAWAYDSQNNLITDIIYSWSVNNDLGTILQQGTQAVTFKASSDTGTCMVNVTIGGKSASSIVTITSEVVEKEEPEDEAPEDLLWLWFLIFVIIVLFVINLWLVLRKERQKDEEELDSGESVTPEETVEESQEMTQDSISEPTSPPPPQTDDSKQPPSTP
jgi:parallel beta-helix repeat protein